MPLTQTEFDRPRRERTISFTKERLQRAGIYIEEPSTDPDVIYKIIFTESRKKHLAEMHEVLEVDTIYLYAVGIPGNVAHYILHYSLNEDLTDDKSVDLNWWSINAAKRDKAFDAIVKRLSSTYEIDGG